MTEDNQDSTGKIAHLQMIQGVINRMAGNSFMLKGWTVALLVAVTAMNKEGWISPPEMCIGGILIVGVFWFLDAYYLAQEQEFRDIYNNVRNKTPDQIDYSMTPKIETNPNASCSLLSRSKRDSSYGLCPLRLSLFSLLIWFIINCTFLSFRFANEFPF